MSVRSSVGSEEGHIGGAMLHHRPEQASVFFANLVDILLELLLRFLVQHCGTPLLAKQFVTLSHSLVVRGVSV